MYDNFFAGFAQSSGMLRASGYQIPPLNLLFSGYQPTFSTFQVQQGNTHS